MSPWDEKADKWLWDSCGYAPDTSVAELAEWMEKAENWDKVLSFGQIQKAKGLDGETASAPTYAELVEKLDASNKEGLEHHAIAVEYYEKLEAIKKEVIEPQLKDSKEYLAAHKKPEPHDVVMSRYWLEKGIYGMAFEINEILEDTI